MTAILHIETRHRTGGAERNVNHLAAWQRDHGYQVGLAFGPDSLPSEIPDGVRPLPVPRLGRSIDPVRDALVIRDLGHLIQQGGWDVVHTHQSKAGIVGRVAARGRARVILHTVHMNSFGPGYGRIPSTMFRQAERRVAGWTDLLIAVGEELRERYLAAGIGSPDRFRVVHSPVDIARFAATRAWTAEARLGVRRELGLSEAAPLVLVVSALEPRKRVDLVVDRLAVKLRGGWSLAIAGEGAERPALEAQVAREGLVPSVRLLGSRPDIERLMAGSNALVHAAQAEGVPQVVLQALAAGLPIVATEVVGLREVSDATISVGASDGRDLSQRVAAALDSPPGAAPLRALDPWTPSSVEAAIAQLHAELGLEP